MGFSQSLVHVKSFHKPPQHMRLLAPKSIQCHLHPVQLGNEVHGTISRNLNGKPHRFNALVPSLLAQRPLSNPHPHQHQQQSLGGVAPADGS